MHAEVNFICAMHQQPIAPLGTFQAKGCMSGLISNQALQPSSVSRLSKVLSNSYKLV